MQSDGQMINDRYILQYEIGRGGMSKVYLARDTKLNMDWAIKVLDVSEKSSHAQIYKIATEKEISILKSLKHPALPRIVDYFLMDEKMYIVMDYIEGCTLMEKLEREGKQKEEDVVKWTRAVCDVLHYLHTRKNAIIYRDIKPSNIMLTPEGEIKLIDFGIARTFKSTSSSDTEYLGSRGYAAPEQCSQSGQSDERTDIYGVGATMYHLLTGKHPDQPPYEFYPIRKWDRSFSRGIQLIVQKCVMTDPKYRYQTAFDLIDALDNYHAEDRKKYGKLAITWIMFLGFIISVLMTAARFGKGEPFGWTGLLASVFLLGTFSAYSFLNISRIWRWFLGKEDKEIMKTKRHLVEEYRPSSTQQLDKMRGNISYSTYHAGTETIKMGDQRMNRVNKYFQFYVITSMKSVGVETSSEEDENDEW